MDKIGTQKILTTVLREMITERFPEIEIAATSPDGPAIVIPARHRGIGNVSILDDGDEATLDIANITHGHFCDYTPNISEVEAARAISGDVVGFLAELFADRVLLWRSPPGGGWRILQQEEEPRVHSDADTQFYFWSGPVG